MIEKTSASFMSMQIDLELSTDNDSFQEQLPHHYRSILASFRKTARSFAVFNAIFILIAAVEVATFLFLLPWLNGSSSVALMLSTLFLTLFSYLVLLFYYQAKKPDQLDDLVEGFIASCRSSLGLAPIVNSKHLSVAEALLKLSQYLTDYEARLFQGSEKYPALTRLIARSSANFYWHDVFNFKRALLRSAIEEHLHQIRLTPTDLELHASLANAYVALSQLYKKNKSSHNPRSRRKFYRKNEALCQEKFTMYGTLAIEEFQILNQYAPNDPWIHEQLAAGYKALSMPHEEIREVECLLQLRPNDREVFFLLGKLYFEQGFNAKGLRIYEELKKANFPKADDLLSSYGQGSAVQFQD